VEHFKRVERAVHGLTSRWRAAPSISVVGDAAALPFRAPFPILGAHMDDEVFVVADAQSAEKALATLAHEAIGHHGFREMLGVHWVTFMAQVLGAVRAGDSSLGLARDTVRDMYVGDDGQCNLQPIDEADEIVAKMVEWAFDPTTGQFNIDDPLRKQLRALATHSARELLQLDIPLTREELEGAIEASAHTVRHGAPLFGFARWLPGWYASRMKPMGPRVPARDLADSQQLLEAERYRKSAKVTNGAVRSFLFVIATLGALVWSVFMFLGWLLR